MIPSEGNNIISVIFFSKIQNLTPIKRKKNQRNPNSEAFYQITSQKSSKISTS